MLLVRSAEACGLRHVGWPEANSVPNAKSHNRVTARPAMLRLKVLRQGVQGGNQRILLRTGHHEIQTIADFGDTAMLHTGIGTFCKWAGVAFVCAPGLALAQTVVGSLISPSSLTGNGWSFGSQAGGNVAISTDTSLNYNGHSGSVVGSYPVATGNVYAWGDFSVASLHTEDIYIDFWAKMPAAKQGLKFLKIFGANQGAGYANTTFSLDYTGYDFGAMYQVSFGDGTGLQNDTANVINFDGSSPSLIGRSYGLAAVSTPQMTRFASSQWGTSWHHFQMHVKFNSGTSSANEVNDGAYYVAIDDKVYVNATGLFNRNPSNGPIDYIELLGWSQNGSTPLRSGMTR
jgi:hypothetical protein